MEKQPEEPAVTEAGSAETKAPEESVAPKPSEPVVSEVKPGDQEESNEKGPAKEEEKSEQKEVGGDVGSEKEEGEKEEEPAKKQDEPERKKEDDPEETAEEFEDAVDTVGEPDEIELPEKFTTSGGDSTRSSRRGSVRSDAASSDENMPRLRVTESETVEIESSPEKSPKLASAKATPPPGPGPSKVVKSAAIETVDLDDDDDEEEEEYDEERSFEEDSEDDYYDDPESDDQDVNRVIQDAVDEIDAMDNPESGEEDKMDVSSDDEGGEDYSDDEDDDERQRSVVAAKGADKRKRGESDYSEGEIYDADDGDEYDQVGEVDEPGRSFRPSKSRVVSLGQISVDDDSDEEEESPKKQAGGKVKYKSYRHKLVAGIRKRTFKILNKPSMHVMEEGSDATLVCSADATTAAAAAKVVSLKTSSVATSTPVTTTSSKSPAPEEARLGSAKPEAPLEVSKATPVEEESKKSGGDENKENMTVKDNAAVSVVEEKVKQVKEDENKKGKESEDDEVMSGMMDDLEGGQQKDCTYRNGSKTEDFNDELTFQMDVDGGSQQSSEGGGGDDTEEGEDDEEEEESGAVDLSSSTETVNKPESSPEKSSTKVDEPPVRKPEVPVEKPDLSSAKKVVKVEPVEMPEERREEQASVDLSSKTSPKEKPVSRKRRRSVEEYEDEEDAEPVVPSKKLKRELECNFRAHDRLLKEYIETTSNDSMEDVQKNTELLMVEIQTLNDMIRAKENEWNNMIHLKKVKEEILMRLTRKKNVLNIVQTKLGEEPPADYSLSNVRSASVGPRPPTPPPEVDIRPASVTPLHNSRQSAHSSLLNDSRRHSTANASSSSSANIFAQFNHINSSVTMVPLSTSPSLITSTNTILQSRANMKPAELAKEKPNAAQIQRQILPKPILSNHQQILNNLAMSAGLTAANATSSTISNSTTSTNTMAAAAIAANNILAGLGLSAQAAALLNGHHNPGQNAQQQNHLQVGRQGVIKDVKSIIADYRQKHPEQVPRRGRRLKNIPSSSSSYDGKGSSADARMRELSFLLAAAENTSRPSSNDSSQSNSNAPPTTLPGAVSFKDVLVQFAKMSQSDRTLLSSLSSLSNAVTAAATAASAGTCAVVATTTNCSSSFQQRSAGNESGSGSTVPSLGKAGAYPEVTLHPVMNSSSSSNANATTAELNLSNGTSANQSQAAANSSSNSLLHGILTKSSSRPNPATGTAATTSNPGFTSFSPTLARLLTAPERMNSAAAQQQQQASTVTSGALANLQASTGLNLSKSNSEITITPVGGGSNSSSSIQQSLLQAAAAHQQLQEQQKQLQRLREQHFMNMDDEAEDSVDRLVIDEGDDHHHDGGHVNNSGHHLHQQQQQRNHGREPSVVITTRGGGSSGGNGPEFHENDVPECQGCKKREAQFVCAGCGNQWYCSRECQVNAWDDHSEVCTG